MALFLGDCLEIMPTLPAASVDLILCDLPYGTTACAWDAIIPFEPLWQAYRRIAKPNAAIVLTAAQPFTSRLVVSALDIFKYCWVWDKVNKFTGALNAKRMPMLDYEDVAVFYGSPCTYNPQLRPGKYVTRHTTGNRNTGTVGKSNHTPDVGRIVEGLQPKRILSIPSHSTAKSLHPTQKPVELMEYFVRTYSDEGDTVLDNCMGSGTTGLAALKNNRRFIGIERDPHYFEVAKNRLGVKQVWPWS